MDKNTPEMRKRVEKLQLAAVKRHMFLCVGDKCCKAEDGMKTWEYLKERCRSQDAMDAGVYRSKAGCLRICREGPVAVVYPEGIWYRDVTPDVCKRIVEEHLIQGKIVEEFKILEHPLHPGEVASIGVGEAP